MLGKIIILMTWFVSSVHAQDSFNVDKFNWESGQIIATSQPGYDGSTFLFEMATGSLYGHIGIVVVKADGKIVVHESTPPSGAVETPIEEFLKRSTQKIKGRKEVFASVVKVDGLSSSELKRILAKTKSMNEKEIPYNYEQYMNNSSLNCSEYVYEAFNAAGVSLTNPQTKKDLNMGALGGLLAQQFDNFATSARFISPASLILTDKVSVVAANLPTDRVISEKEVLDHWKSVPKGLESVARDLFGIPESMVSDSMAQIEPILNFASDKPYRVFVRKQKLTCSAALAI